MNQEASEARTLSPGQRMRRAPGTSGGRTGSQREQAADAASSASLAPSGAAPAPTPSIEAPQTPSGVLPAANPGWLTNLWQRIQSALVLIPIVVALVFCGGWYAFAGALVALLLDTFELRSMFVTHKGWRPHITLSVALGLDFLVAAMFPAQREILIFFGVGAVIIVSFVLFLRSHATFEDMLRDWALTLAIPFYLGWPIGLFLLLRGYDFGIGSRGFWWTLATFGMVWANDAAAYAVGHYLGKRKLAPYISPAKTWEGFFGGAVFAIIASFVLTLPLHIPWYIALALGILVAIAATVGDLAESLIKRGTGVKDSGTIIPGHGGLLDRMDSLLFAVIIVASFATIIDKLL